MYKKTKHCSLLHVTYNPALYQHASLEHFARRENWADVERILNITKKEQHLKKYLAACSPVTFS